MARLDWNKHKHAGKAHEPAFKPEKKKLKGAATHIKREPVRVCSAEERVAYMKAQGWL